MRTSSIIPLMLFILLTVTAYAVDDTPRVVMYSLGETSDEWIDFASDIISAAYRYQVDIRGDIAIQNHYSSDDDDAYFAREILNDIDVIAAVEGTRVLVLTEHKLRRTAGVNTICGGLSHSSRGTAIFSTYNVNSEDTDRTTVFSRIAKRILHEVGHSSGLHHCKQPLCYMTAFADATGNDKARFVLCPRCSAVLEDNTGIDYENARETLTQVLIEWDIIDSEDDEKIVVPPSPDDLSYDMTGTEKAHDVTYFELCPRCSRSFKENTGIDPELAYEYLIRISSMKENAGLYNIELSESRLTPDEMNDE